LLLLLSLSLFNNRESFNTFFTECSNNNNIALTRFNNFRNDPSERIEVASYARKCSSNSSKCKKIAEVNSLIANYAQQQLQEDI